MLRLLATVGSIALAAAPAAAALRSHWFAPPVDEAVPEVAAHYLISNEARHDLFAAGSSAPRGGAYLGVGSEQNYTLIGLLRPERAYLLDHDRRIGALHRELGRRIAASPTPEALLAGLDAGPADPELAGVWPALAGHLRRVRERPRRGLGPTWLGDPVLYDVVRARWLAGAVEVVLGDLAGDTAMPSIAAAAASRGLEFSALYLSNAEEVAPAPERIAANLAALPRAAGAVLLRTRAGGPEPAADGLWSYHVAPLE